MQNSRFRCVSGTARHLVVVHCTVFFLLLAGCGTSNPLDTLHSPPPAPNPAVSVSSITLSVSSPAPGSSLPSPVPVVVKAMGTNTSMRLKIEVDGSLIFDDAADHFKADIPLGL